MFLRGAIMQIFLLCDFSVWCTWDFCTIKVKSHFIYHNTTFPVACVNLVIFMPLMCAGSQREFYKAHVLNPLSWRRTLVCMLYGPKNTELSRHSWVGWTDKNNGHKCVNRTQISIMFHLNWALNAAISWFPAPGTNSQNYSCNKP